jgi:ribonucleoside-diphosphate reductase alpha chain
VNSTRIIYKYGIKNRVEKKVYETPQFTYIRMAMALAKDETTSKMEDILNWYKFFSANLINTPTPNFNNLGTLNRGYASCCLFAAGDTIPSLAAADHIGYMMTAASAGLGRSTLTRSIGDPVRNGAIIHQGKMPYWRHEETAVISNTQGGRGGSETTFVSIYDPEVRKALMAQNTRTPIKDQIRNIHFAFL